MAIAAEPSSPSIPPSAADWVAVSVAAALETSVTTSPIVASAAIAVAVANKDYHLHDGHNVDNCLHDEHDEVIAEDGLTLSPSPLVICPVDHGDQRQCPSPGLMMMMMDDRTDNVEEEEHGMPSSTGVEAFAMMGGNN
jgi:hypothetical protein